MRKVETKGVKELIRTYVSGIILMFIAIIYDYAPYKADTWQGFFFADDPPPISIEGRSPVEDPGYNYLILRLGAVIVVWWLACTTVDRQVCGSKLPHARAL